MSARTWRILVVICLAAGLAVRLASVLTRPHLLPAGDPGEYWGQANLLAQGKGFIEPLVYGATGHQVQTAKLPPLYTMLLSLCSVVGFKSFLAHRIWSCVLSALGIPVAAALGREVAGRAVGVLTALGVAFYPNIWMSAGIGMSETISPVMAMLVLWAGYRAWRSPTRWRAAVLGLAIGFAALARDELIVFAGLVLLPVAYGPRRDRRPWRPRLALFAAGLAAALAVLVPWVTYNMVRFSHPVLITDRLGVTLAAANCEASWHGDLTGYWSQPCSMAAVADVEGDESAQNSVATRVGLRYIERHAGGLPRLEGERLGRTFAFWRVRQQMQLDIFVEGRPATWVWVGLWSFYGLVALAPFGLVRLRRMGVATFPLWAVLADVVLVVLITYGETRFRATLEPVLVLLGAVALCWDFRLALETRSFSTRRRGSAWSRAPSGPRSGPSPDGAPPSASVV